MSRYLGLGFTGLRADENGFEELCFVIRMQIDEVKDIFKQSLCRGRPVYVASVPSESHPKP